MFELIAVATALIGSLAVGSWDLKTSNVPGKIVFPMLAAGVLLHAAESLLSGSYAPIVLCLEVGVAYSLFSIMMYYLGAWGDGDSALFAAVGFLVPAAPSFAAATVFPFALTYFMNVFIIGAAYSIAYSAALVLKSRKLRAGVAKAIRADARFYPILLVPAIAACFFLPLPAVFLLAALIVALPPLYRISCAVEKGLQRRISTRELRADDIVGQDIPFLGIKKRFIRGLTKKEVAIIRRRMKYVLVRDGIRYTMVFFIALAFTLVVGDFLSFLF
ncbi:MAG: prepilin peptidase [Candidatus Aenigmatarchaeota archaeon]